MKHILPALLMLALLAACASPGIAPSPPPDSPVSSDTPPAPEEIPPAPYLPLPSDSNLQRGNVFIESADLLVMESFPLQFLLNLAGGLPTPCHQLRVVVSPPDTENKIAVEVYSLVNPDMMCIQVLKEFTQGINLGSFPAGHYEIWINGEKSLEFDA